MRLLNAGSVGVGSDGTLRCKKEGLACLPGDDRQAVEAALALFAEVGIFVVPVGELERWLPMLGVTNKKTWVTDMLTRLGSRGTGVYVEPGEGDVWAFVELLAAWLNDPLRRGIAA